VEQTGSLTIESIVLKHFSNISQWFYTQYGFFSVE